MGSVVAKTALRSCFDWEYVAHAVRDLKLQQPNHLKPSVLLFPACLSLWCSHESPGTPPHRQWLLRQELASDNRRNQSHFPALEDKIGVITRCLYASAPHQYPC